MKVLCFYLFCLLAYLLAWGGSGWLVDWLGKLFFILYFFTMIFVSIIIL